jgi:hypothetical protein
MSSKDRYRTACTKWVARPSTAVWRGGLWTTAVTAVLQPAAAASRGTELSKGTNAHTS